MDKKARERLFLNEISTLYKDFPLGTIIEHESPDFIIDDNGNKLGIEMQDYIRGQTSVGSEKRYREMVLKKIIDKAQSEFESNCSIPVFVTFFWFPHRKPQKADISRFAKTIVSLLMNNIPSEPPSWVAIENEVIRNLLIGEFLHSMILIRTKNHSPWTFVDGDLTDMRNSEIEWLISSKKGKISQYLSECNKVWLIIVADREYISSFGDLTPKVFERPYKTKFERVLFYDRVNRIVFQLPIIS
jgi:hypothetical protein